MKPNRKQWVNRLFLLLITLLLIPLNSCEEDDTIVDSNTPGFDEFTSSISTAPGLEFIVEGTISDDQGLEYVNLNYENWFLNKDIEFESAPKQYTLKYKFMVPADETPDSNHTIQISATDVGGNTITHDVVVSLNFDTEKPQIEIVSPEPGQALTIGESFMADATFTDDKALDSVIVTSEAIGYEFKMKMDEGTTSYHFDQTIEIPAEGAEGAVNFQFTAIDATGNQEVKNIVALVGESNEIYEMYVVGGSAWWEWDVSKSSQMWKNPDNDKEFMIEMYYWSDYGIKFVGQLDWAPINIGLDPSGSGSLVNHEDSGELNFPDLTFDDNWGAYVRIYLNPYTMEYRYEQMTVDIAVEDDMYLMGNGFVGYDLDWNPADAIPMDADPWGNPYVFTSWIEISEDTSLKFIGQTDGWGPLDIGFETGGELTLPLNYVKTKSGDGSADAKFKGQAGWYYITFDYFLNRATIQPYTE